MAKFTLAIAPTFAATVAIPVPGKGTADVVFTFKHRDRTAFRALMDSLQEPDEDRTDTDLVLDIASGWDLDEPFDEEHVTQLVERFIGSGRAILDAYMREQTGARQKN
jgi:hypothetical protein